MGWIWIAWLIAGPTPDASDAADDSATELAIYPGFERHELGRSVDVTLKGARTCVALGTRSELEVGEATARYLRTVRVARRQVTLTSVQVEFTCPTQPVTSCRFLTAWDPEEPDLRYSTVECRGSHDDAGDTYAVSATWDLRHAGSARRAVRTTSVAFHTSTFPGTSLLAFGSRRSGDGQILHEPTVERIDDWDQGAGATAGVLDAEGLDLLARRIHDDACIGTGYPGCTPRQTP